MKKKVLTGLSDEMLLARIQDGDNEALDVLIHKYENLLKTIIRGEIRNAAEVDDVYQNTVRAIINRIRGRGADDINSAEKWMKQVARSKCQDFFGNAVEQSLIREAAEVYYAATADQERQRYFPDLNEQERLLKIEEVVEEMGSIYVEVLELLNKGLTEAEVADVLNISQNTVKSRRHKIRKVVRERLGVSLPSEN